MTADALPLLSPLEIRVLGVLVEKQLTTPDYYPLSLNALVAGCNQKSSRAPLMSTAESEVQNALDSLQQRKLVTNSWGASRRVVRYAHNCPQVLNTDPGTTALLAALMLRGPQTPGELRIACERMYRFADLSSVEAYLEQMVVRLGGALLEKLPKQPGAREHRWAHRLGGPAGAATDAPVFHAGASDASGDALQAEMARLRDEMAGLRAIVERLMEAMKK